MADTPPVLVLAFSFAYATPTPSLCDTCKHAGPMGGSVTTNHKTYQQRYCSKLCIGIHDRGLQTCDDYVKR